MLKQLGEGRESLTRQNGLKEAVGGARLLGLGREEGSAWWEEGVGNPQCPLRAGGSLAVGWKFFTIPL